MCFGGAFYNAVMFFLTPHGLRFWFAATSTTAVVVAALLYLVDVLVSAQHALLDTRSAIGLKVGAMTLLLCYTSIAFTLHGVCPTHAQNAHNSKPSVCIKRLKLPFRSCPSTA